MIKAIVLDLDDTLCLTEAVCFEMENEVLGKIGHPPMSREMHVETWGKPLFDVIATRSPGVNVDEFRDAYNPIIAQYTATGKLDSIPAENYRAMDRLIELGKTLMVLTSRTHSELQHLLEPDHMLANRVKTFYYRDNMDFHKPDPRAFDGLMADEGLSPAQCLYVGDSLGDAEAAKKAGLYFVASLESGLRVREDFDDLPVDAFISRFPDIVEVVLELDGSTPKK